MASKWTLTRVPVWSCSVSSGLAADTKDRIKQANDIVDLIGSYMELRRQGSNFVCPLPLARRPSSQFAGQPGPSKLGLLGL